MSIKPPAIKREKAVKEQESGLLTALRFVSTTQNPEGSTYQTHVRLQHNWALGFDGVLAAGHPIQEALLCCPHSSSLISAITKCKTAISITSLENGQLGVKAGRFKAFIPCVSGELIPLIYPDPKAGSIDDRLKEGFKVLAPWVKENTQNVATSSILLNNGSMAATNRHVVLEYWHGINLPDNIILPKIFIDAVLKIDKKLAAFGYSERSFTVYYEDGSWLRTQQYQEGWPDVGFILNVQHNAQPVPEGFFEGVSMLQPFCKLHNDIYLLSDKITTNIEAEQGAHYDLAGLPEKVGFNAKYLCQLAEHVTHIDLQGVNKASIFFGKNLRGAIAQVSIKD